jgi:hypothetical protein
VSLWAGPTAYRSGLGESDRAGGRGATIWGYMYRFWVFVHLLGVFGFLLAHGTSAALAFALRRERQLDRVRALVDLSSSTLSVLYASLLLLLAGGIAAGFVGHWWGSGWIWAALVLLVAMILSMYALGNGYVNRVREAVGVQTYDQKRKGVEAKPPASDPEIEAALMSPLGPAVGVVGTFGLVVILWLMVFKPF